MAHTIASIGHVLSCSCCGLLWIAMDYRLSWTIMDCHGLSWIIVDYNGLWTMLDYHGLAWIMDYHGLSWINGAYHGLWTIMDYCDYCGALWVIVDYRGSLNMHQPGIAWITRYAPQASDDT